MMHLVRAVFLAGPTVASAVGVTETTGGVVMAAAMAESGHEVGGGRRRGANQVEAEAAT